MTDITHDLITRKEAARILGVHEVTLGKWAKREEMDLPYIKISRRVMYRKSDIDKFLKRHTLKENNT